MIARKPVRQACVASVAVSGLRPGPGMMAVTRQRTGDARSLTHSPVTSYQLALSAQSQHGAQGGPGYTLIVFLLYKPGLKFPPVIIFKGHGWAQLRTCFRS